MTDEPTEPLLRMAAGGDDLLLAQVREAFGRVVYSQKVHEKQADQYFTLHRWQQGALIALTALSTTTFLASLAGFVFSPQVTSVIVSFVALLVTGLSLATKTFTFAEDAGSHRDVAAQLWDVRESYLSLITDLMDGQLSSDEARERRDHLQETTRATYAGAPRTGGKAFTKAQAGLKENEEMTFTVDEIDLFLPAQLRLRTKGQPA
ncbi:SLATT domain-containing protein [Microbacterium sp. CFBP 8790]|uniref:SLATT domain-containing protein n=1 Tax=unclassified Microbacterium TaxID=2609290 RepID=UPI001785E5EC|nr:MULTISPECIES: SLATT domain-containing protein [unclassified Microbacterium]MBD8206411.1 SLATT domain-containing protein [Microbacterium sp. CFBP 8801]MBD8508393.1 SLATT domain-containing protein [Microbacterium sp. CFBP 8790]